MNFSSAYQQDSARFDEQPSDVTMGVAQPRHREPFK
jgi:hypothetical protein